MYGSTPESLHRLAKADLDSGRAHDVDEAIDALRALRLHLTIDANAASVASHQATLLTSVTLARRVFLGGVTVAGELDVPSAVPMKLGESLRDAVVALGAMIVDVDVEGDVPRISIGGGPLPRSSTFSIRTACAGWRGGIVPGHSALEAIGASATPLAAMLAAALAVNEAFISCRGEMPIAGRRTVGMSLWNPSDVGDWLRDDGAPELQFLPTRLWLIGLGHLGQAYLWALGLHRYEQPGELELVLQDVDDITPSTESTSILSDHDMVGIKKTRAMAQWADRCGYTTSIYERKFDDSFSRRDNEPAVALCGVDNVIARRALCSVGFDFIVEAGLGSGYDDFQTLRVHTLPAERAPEDIWPPSSPRVSTENATAYQAMIKAGTLDQCGATILAGKAVGAPFVGSTAACLVLSEVLRLLHGGAIDQLVDLDLRYLEHRTVVAQSKSFHGINPGFARIRP